jgi:hypothetical protein
MAITKVFSTIDSSSHGIITPDAIPMKVPEAALYFLGSVFQKLRTEHTSLSLPRFIQ